MLNKMLAQIRKYRMISPGDRIICAVSGGADSMALLWAMYLLREKLALRLEAAHFNHGLRGAESDRDEAFVRDFCDGFGIPCHVGRGAVVAGGKGLEAAARDARYSFLNGLGGKIATAHTADDNAETVLMHMVRGTGLKGLGGITPVTGKLIRPMLTITREDVISFLEGYHLGYVQDSSNDTDVFLRNRLRHHVMPLLKEENPSLAQNLSAMAMELREDEAAICGLVQCTRDVSALRQMAPALRSRSLAALLEQSGVKEPSRSHIALAEQLVLSENPSAEGKFPGGVTLRRCYQQLVAVRVPEQVLPEHVLECPGTLEIPQLSLRVICEAADKPEKDTNCFTVRPVGQMVLRSRASGDKMRLPGGQKSLKKLFIDKKIPAAQRMQIPVVADDAGVLGVYNIGPDLDRLADADGVRIRFEKI